MISVTQSYFRLQGVKPFNHMIPQMEHLVQGMEEHRWKDTDHQMQEVVYLPSLIVNDMK